MIDIIFLMSQIILILHNIRSTHNVGAIFRTAEGFGVKHIICSGYTPYPNQNKARSSFKITSEKDSRLPHIRDKLTKQIHKTALDAEKLVPFSYQTEPNIEEIKKLGFKIVALEQSDKSIMIDSYKSDDNIALFLGEEVNGIEEKFLKKCDETIEIPMEGKKESFNVSIACGIAIYAIKFQ